MLQYLLISVLLVTGGRGEDLSGVDVSAILKTVEGLGAILSNINGPANNVKDIVLNGRPVRLNIDNNCVSATDIESGFKSTKCANSSTEAASLAAEELVSLLIKLNFLSYDDLGLKPTSGSITPNKQQCVDKFSSQKCKFHIGLGQCDPNGQFFTWLHMYCFKSCGGCMSKEDIAAALSAGQGK